MSLEVLEFEKPSIVSTACRPRDWLFPSANGAPLPSSTSLAQDCPAHLSENFSSTPIALPSMAIHTGPAGSAGAQLLRNGTLNEGNFPTWSVSDGILFLFILIGWAAALCLFLHKWGDVRIPLPRDLIRRFRPMNVDSVLIVNQEKKSIIYKSYGKRMSVTMEERDKRLEELRAQQSEGSEEEDQRPASRWSKFKQRLPFSRSEAAKEAEMEEGAKRRLSALSEVTRPAGPEAQELLDPSPGLVRTESSYSGLNVAPEGPVPAPGHRGLEVKRQRRCVTPEIRVESFDTV